MCESATASSSLAVPGERGLPYARPAEAVRAIDPDDAEGIALAETRAAGRRRRCSDSPLFRATGGVENALLRAGVLNLVAAAIIVGCSTSRSASSC